MASTLLLSTAVVVLLLLLLIPCVTAQVAQCASDGSPQLRFVAQLSVSGCALFVHDTGASDGPHLAVDPIMCVTEGLRKVAPRYDPVTQLWYVSVPVTLRDDAMLAEAQRQLRHLSPKSVKFATVSDISVSTDNSSLFQALRFNWSPEEPIGFLSLGCKPSLKDCSNCMLASRFRKSEFAALDQVMLLVTVTSNDTHLKLNYRLQIQNSRFINSDFYGGRFDCVRCEQLGFIRTIRLINCTARVHKRLDCKGHFLIEPLLCHNITNMSSESVRYDFSRDMHYLKLDVVLQDDMALDAVRTQLADLSPLNVTFMRLLRAQSHVDSALSRRFEIGPLMVSVNGRSAQLRVYCRTVYECTTMMAAVLAEPVDLWNHVRYSVTSLASDSCILKSDALRHPWRMRESGGDLTDQSCREAEVVNVKLQDKIAMTADGRRFIKIQQRLTGSVSFQRTWAEYEEGFGDDTDFWIGLSAIHSLSKNGATLRVEMKLWDGTELHAEYAGFKVGDASTKYRMAYREMLTNMSSVSHDAMEKHKGMQFSTMDRDNDGASGSCSDSYGKGGWWFNACHDSNPNGIYHPVDSTHAMYCCWNTGSRFTPLREVRLMLQI